MHVVGDDEHRSPGVGEIAEQFPDPFGQFRIERGGGFVGDDHSGIGDDGGCDRGTLRHTAGDLVRIPVEGAAGQVYAVAQFTGGVRRSEYADYLVELIADGPNGGE